MDQKQGYAVMVVAIVVVVFECVDIVAQDTALVKDVKLIVSGCCQIDIQVEVIEKLAVSFS